MRFVINYKKVKLMSNFNMKNFCLYFLCYSLFVKFMLFFLILFKNFSILYKREKKI